jgi:hypothetical protein
MPCLVVALGLIAPRVTIVVLWFFTNWFAGVFQTALWPVLGFLLMPVTLLWYSVVVNFFGGEWTIVPIIGMIIAVLVDIGAVGSARR